METPVLPLNSLKTSAIENGDWKFCPQGQLAIKNTLSFK